MVYKTILVQVDGSKGWEARLSYAAQLATLFSGHLVGVHAKPLPYVPPLAYEAVPTDFIEQQRKAAEASAVAAEKNFRTATDKFALSSPAEWRCEEGNLDRVIAKHARYADLVVVSQTQPEEPDASLVELPGDLLLAAGRPILLVPYTSTPKLSGSFNHILVAWDGGREAARAITDAMPLLTKAKKTTVIAINPEQNPWFGEPIHGQEPCADMAQYLARHGVKAEAAHIQAKDISVADALLSRAADLSCDLLVMGGYGRSRLREQILGGTTQSILKQLTLPVLMSH